MTFDEYIIAAAEHHRKFAALGNYRVGQAYFNTLPKYIADDVVNSELDPFEDDSKLPQLLAYLACMLPNNERTS